MQKPGGGKLIRREQIYSGKIVELLVDHIEVQGREALREVVRHPGGVVILAEVEPDRIPFVRQHRYPMDQFLLELPAGKLEPGEDSAQHAARELEEETGFRPETLDHVCSFYSSPGYCDELLHLYYTDSVRKTSMNLEEGEELEVEFYSLSEALGLCFRGGIVDAKTMVALLWLYWRRQND